MKAPTIFAEVLTLAVSLVLATAAVTAGLLLFAPPPNPGRMSVDEMAFALRPGASRVIVVHTSAAAPVGRRSPLLEAALARALGRREDEIRAVWLHAPNGGSWRGQSVLLIDEGEALLKGGADGLNVRTGATALLSPHTFVPLFAAAVRIPDGGWRVGRPKDPAAAEWSWRVLLSALAGAALSAALASLVARRVARPVEALALAAQVAAPARPPAPLTSGSREVRAAGDALTAMHSRLAQAAEERATLVAAVAHDLRTPVTAMRLRVERLEEPARTRLTADLRRIATLAENLLELSRLGALHPRLQDVDVTALASTCCEARRELGAEVIFAPAAPIRLRTDPDLLGRALDNLLDNALLYGSRARISVTHSAQVVTLRVQDDGPGIDPTLLSEVVKPFVRVEPSRNRERSNAGLGLAVVAAVIEVLEGQLVMTNDDPGFSAELRLSKRTRSLIVPDAPDAPH